MPDPNANPEGVTVELDENGQPVKPAEKPAQGGEKQYVTLDQLEEMRKKLNGLSYIGRKMSDIERLMKQAPARPAPVVDPASADPDDVLLEKDWKAAVRKQARVEAEAILSERERMAQQEREAEESKNRLASAKKHVIDKYPDIMKDETEIAQRYVRVINEHPEYLHNDFGPILAMRDMEDELRKEGRLDEVTKKVVDAEVARRARADGGSATRTSTGGATKKIVLSAEQKAVADSLGVKYEVYAKILEKDLRKEGVEA